VVAALRTDPERGLGANEGAERLRRYGPNELKRERPLPAWRPFLRQFQDVLVIMLLVGAAISFGLWLYQPAASSPWAAVVIVAIEVLNATLGFIQEVRAERAVAALRALSAATATVVRDGRPQRVPATDVVPRDILLINAGDTIPADARLLEPAALQTAEAPLTGESEPVSKRTDAIGQEAALGDRRNMVFSGTAAVRGWGRAVITAGPHTEMGKIAGLLERAEAESTPLQRELERTGKLLAGAVIGIAAVVVASIVATQPVREPAALLNLLIFGVALAVAAVPEGLPAVVTATLSLRRP
jgi:Ca2+-transporting ATPase